jgi:hypothetical protein
MELNIKITGDSLSDLQQGMKEIERFVSVGADSGFFAMNYGTAFFKVSDGPLPFETQEDQPISQEAAREMLRVLKATLSNIENDYGVFLEDVHRAIQKAEGK